MEDEVTRAELIVTAMAQAGSLANVFGEAGLHRSADKALELAQTAINELNVELHEKRDLDSSEK